MSRSWLLLPLFVSVACDRALDAGPDPDTLVIMEAEHLCMTMRGVKKPGAKTITSVVRGIFRENPATRSEAMSLIYGGSKPL